MQADIDRLRAVASDTRNSKFIRQAALRQLRPLERAAGVPLAEVVKTQ
jgi:hypothetical protein